MGALPRSERATRTSTIVDVLEGHARRSSTAYALGAAADARALTWQELAEGTALAAAALEHAGVCDDHAVLLLLPAAPSAVEVELAVRATGALPVHLAAGVSPGQARELLAGLDIRVVVVTDAARLAQLREVDLGGAELLDLTVDTWDYLLELGAAVEGPTDGIHRQDAGVVLVGTAGVVHVHASHDPVVGAVDRVLLTGAADPWGWDVRARHLRDGGRLTWTDDAAALPDLFAAARPEAIAVGADLQRSFLAAVAGARVSGRAWHGRPRRGVGAVDALRPWFGGELEQLEWAGQAGDEVQGLCRGLGLRLEAGRPAPEPAEPGTRARLVPVATLPRRSPTSPDESFQLVAAVEEVVPAPAVLAAPPLLSGESFLDRHLTRQRHDPRTQT